MSIKAWVIISMEAGMRLPQFTELAPHITRDAERYLVSLYKVYCSHRKAKISHSDIMMFTDTEELLTSIVPSFSPNDVLKIYRELSKNGYICCMFFDETIYTLRLQELALRQLERKFSDLVKDDVEFVAQFIPGRS